MADVVLSAEEHFESLREAVWVRFVSRHHGVDRERFEDLYSEWWTRECERCAQGSPSRATAPAAFIAESVHRVLIDDLRARGRGLGRDAKGELEVVDIDDQLALAGPDDTAAGAGYEALVHRVLALVHGRLTERELRVFVFSFLYMQGVEVTAQALGLSPPRVKKDRRRIVAKVGSEAWAVMTGELDLCAVYEEKSLPAAFELMSVHVEDCPTCRAALGGVRSSALAIVGPELLVVQEPATHVLSHLAAKFHGVLHRGSEALTVLPPTGRTAAAVAVAATAVAGGAATVEVTQRTTPKPPVRRQVARREPVKRAALARTPAARIAVAPRPTAAPARHRARPVRTASSRAQAAPTQAPPVEAVSFEQQSSPAPVASSASASKPSKTTTEFGFEQP
jgi:DNA-directed RNA polymerase specialized sigma24 family protein